MAHPDFFVVFSELNSIFALIPNDIIIKCDCHLKKIDRSVLATAILNFGYLIYLFIVQVQSTCV